MDRPQPGHKPCRTCHQTKPFGDFYAYPKNRDGHSNRCKACTTAENKRHRDSDPGRQWALRLWQRYRLTPQRYAELVATQGGVCGVCRQDRPLLVDHDHRCCPGTKSCGACVRGLLCHGCNVGLGFFNDDVDAMLAALRYLQGVGHERPPVPVFLEPVRP